MTVVVTVDVTAAEEEVRATIVRRIQQVPGRITIYICADSPFCGLLF